MDWVKIYNFATECLDELVSTRDKLIDDVIFKALICRNNFETFVIRIFQIPNNYLI